MSSNSFAISLSVTYLFDIDVPPGSAKLLLRWTAPGDDGAEGTASVYDLRMSNSLITHDNFLQAAPILNVPAPHVAGTIESIELILPAGEYYFAIKVADEVPNWSPLSNVPYIIVGVFPPVFVIWE